MSAQRICLVSPGHLASNPRLIKEANSLHAAGFQVKVIAGNYMPALHPLDQGILANVGWSCVKVGTGSRPGYLGRRVLREWARQVVKTGWVPHRSLAKWAHSPFTDRLAQAAVAEPADLYIAHCLAALPAAAKAAQTHKAHLGFDAEDFHAAELLDTPENRGDNVARVCIEGAYLPQCRHLTAASPLIAAAYADRYQVTMQPLLNVFPLADAPASPERQVGDRIGSEPSLYWFSQTIGAGRGLEAIIQAMGQMRNTRAAASAWNCSNRLYEYFDAVSPGSGRGRSPPPAARCSTGRNGAVGCLS
ncbi:hypothetical protein K9N68_14775 [Kovacikia minuta CCNUW1]|uniref:hypothetical protein n=1 Tax=Kovacikia minuta TaxID=2931930 RepID=UPI001CCB67BF|nr:hypothetical protein [Kovacikia minuta]UBF28985.1 hypothetical protein K9N68_14775 [Kovacikia minuta CCNUW1]